MNFTFIDLEIDIHDSPNKISFNVIGEFGCRSIQPLLALELIVQFTDLWYLIQNLIIIVGPNAFAARVMIYEGFFEPGAQFVMVHGFIVLAEVCDP